MNNLFEEMTDCCEKCKFYHRLKHNFKKGVGFKESHCCDVLFHIDCKNESDYQNSWIQEVTPDSKCEMFVAR